MLRAPDDGLRAQQAGNPNRRMRLLQRQRPWIDETIMEMLALVAPWAGLRPCLDDEVVRLVEQLAVEARIRIGRELFAARSAHPSGDKPSARDHVDHREFLGQPQRISDYRQRIAQQHDFHFFSDPRQNRGFHVHHRAHAERGVMVFIEHDAVEAQLLGEDLLVEIFVQEL